MTEAGGRRPDGDPGADPGLDDDDAERGPKVETVRVSCPYCGRTIELVVDCSVGTQDYVEDCSVCCHPIEVHVMLDEEGDPIVSARHEDDG